MCCGPHGRGVGAIRPALSDPDGAGQIGHAAPSAPRPQVGARLKKLYSPNLEKALTFLDDKLLPATSNAVERGNRRFARCKRVSTACGRKSSGASSLEMWREAQAEGRQQTLALLHLARAG